MEARFVVADDVPATIPEVVIRFTGIGLMGRAYTTAATIVSRVRASATALYTLSNNSIGAWTG